MDTWSKKHTSVRSSKWPRPPAFYRTQNSTLPTFLCNENSFFTIVILDLKSLICDTRKCFPVYLQAIITNSSVSVLATRLQADTDLCCLLIWVKCKFGIFIPKVTSRSIPLSIVYFLLPVCTPGAGPQRLRVHISGRQKLSLPDWSRRCWHSNRMFIFK